VKKNTPLILPYLLREWRQEIEFALWDNSTFVLGDVRQLRAISKGEYPSEQGNRMKHVVIRLEAIMNEEGDFLAWDWLDKEDLTKMLFRLSGLQSLHVDLKIRLLPAGPISPLPMAKVHNGRGFPDISRDFPTQVLQGILPMLAGIQARCLTISSDAQEPGRRNEPAVMVINCDKDFQEVSRKLVPPSKDVLKIQDTLNKMN
jgi:hypothetical protein